MPPAAAATLLLLLLLAAALPLSSAATRCPDCGSIRVPYPLSTSPTCGDQSYKVQCDAGGTLLFDTLNNSYPITSVDPESQRFVIEPASLLANTCVTSDLVHQGVQLNSSLPFNVTSSNTILYLNCTTLLLSSPLNCSSASLCHTYVNGTRDAAACGAAPICCTFGAGGSTTSYSIRVRDAGCRAYTSFVNLDTSEPVSLWPKPGMEIQWVLPPEPVCGAQSDCDGNSTCRPDPAGSGVSRCFCQAGLKWDPTQGVCVEIVTCQDPGGCGTDRTALIAGLTSGIGTALVAAIVALLLYRRHRRIKEAQERLAREREDILNANGGRAAKLFTGKQMKQATDNFSKDRLLGAGGYGEVFRGILDDGTVVAIKCAKVGNTKGTDQVLNEVRILCQVNHRSLVRLLGCCVELEQPLLVYEYIENGTLFEHFRGEGRGKLSWTRRLQIARDTAEGLAYLHFSAVPPIYHRDVKSSNILLDEKLNAKVSDFGLSRLAHTDMSHISTCAQGTLGYLDPEYYRNYQLTDKSDVYSFGVVLLELLTSQKAIDFNRASDDVNLAVYVQRMVEEERIMDVVDPMLKEKASTVDVETMKALGFLAVGCLEERRQNRPSMKEVAEEIEYIISIVTAKVVES
ncbi:wall-associated receptor kinase-like 20 [Rhodamnia argentea]|uniref:Wall-associated receptor kinase-like 20 n=1 Tax=Rhodamnia argentea TaxID=178133 RepID=A0A8B8PHN0_9MYRT|nr:wall-associated receptor kinase-like 20 [Rhodamnia argentea]